MLIAPQRHLPVSIGRVVHAGPAGTVLGDGTRVPRRPSAHRGSASGDCHRPSKSNVAQQAARRRVSRIVENGDRQMLGRSHRQTVPLAPEGQTHLGVGITACPGPAPAGTRPRRTGVARIVGRRGSQRLGGQTSRCRPQGPKPWRASKRKSTADRCFCVEIDALKLPTRVNAVKDAAAIQGPRSQSIHQHLANHLLVQLAHAGLGKRRDEADVFRLGQLPQGKLGADQIDDLLRLDGLTQVGPG